MHTYSNRPQTTVTKAPAVAAKPRTSMGQARNHHPDHRVLEHLLLSRALQARLTVSHPVDAYEQEADRVADEVTRMPEPRPDTTGSSTVHVERKCPSCPEELERAPVDKEEEKEEKRLQSKSEGEATCVVSAAIEDGIRGLDGRGQPLSDTARSFMEPRFGADFGSVRIHTDSRAATLAREANAHAFTVGSNIVFAEGRYEPDSAAGKHLLAHELTHVVQQSCGPAHKATCGRATTGLAGNAVEREADRVADATNAPSGISAGSERADEVVQEVSPQSSLPRLRRKDRGPGDEDPTRRVDRYAVYSTSISALPCSAGMRICRAVSNLAVAGSDPEVGQPGHFVVARGGGPVVVTAATSAAGQAVTWTGGQRQPGDPLARRVPTAAAQAVTIAADTPSDPGAQSVVVHVVNGRNAPANAPARLNFSRQPGDPPGLTPFGLTDISTNSPSAQIEAFLDGSHWVFRVNRISHQYLLGVASGGNINISSAASATQANHCAVVADLTPPAPGTPNGPPRTTYWSRPITISHENSHVTRFYSAPFWQAHMRNAEATIEGAASNVDVDHTMPKTLSANAVVAANAVAHQAVLNTEHAAADAAEFPGTEVFAHDQSNPQYATLIERIKARFLPNAPTGLTATLGPVSIVLQWTHNACNETEYRVFRRSAKGAFTRIAGLPAGSVTFTDSLAGLAAKTTYSYFITAAGAAGQSGRSNQVDVTTP